MFPPSLLVIFQGWGLIDLPRPRVARGQKIIRLHPLLCSASRRTTRPPFLISKLVCPSLLEGGLFGLPLRATFSPAHPLARRDVPLAQARALRLPLLPFKGAVEAALYCAHRTSTVSPCAFCEQEGQPDRSLPILLSVRVARAQETNRLPSLFLFEQLLDHPALGLELVLEQYEFGEEFLLL
jgi:hypothetical protein